MARIRTLKPALVRRDRYQGLLSVARQQHGTTVSPVAWDQVRGR